MRLDAAKDTRGEQEEGCDELEDAVHDDADKPEWKQQEPDKWIENEHEQRGRPADNEQDAEENQLDHRLPPQKIRQPGLCGSLVPVTSGYLQAR